VQWQRFLANGYLVELCDGAHMRQTAQSREKEMSCHPAGMTHAARHRSLYSSVHLKYTCTSQNDMLGCLELSYTSRSNNS
jgi:hypothetical protein